MKEVYLVFKGWDDHDCQPAFESVFSTFELAVARAVHLENEDTREHLEGYPNGTIKWEDAIYHDRYLYRRASNITFGESVGFYDGPYAENVIYIIKAEVDDV